MQDAQTRPKGLRGRDLGVAIRIEFIKEHGTLEACVPNAATVSELT